MQVLQCPYAEILTVRSVRVTAEQLRLSWCPSSCNSVEVITRQGLEMKVWQVHSPRGNCLFELVRRKNPHKVRQGGTVVQCRLMGGRNVGCCCANRWALGETIFSLVVFWAINQKHFWVESYSIRLQHSSSAVVLVWRNSGFSMTQAGCELKLKYRSEI